jgi:hypothetical protein
MALASRWNEYRPSKTAWFWSCVACVVATMIVGFYWGGWVTGSSAQAMAGKATADARAQLAAAVCVNRFESAGDAAVQLASLKKTDSWQRDDFIKNGGWVTIPGTKDPVSGASDLCVDQLMKAQLPPVKAASAQPVKAAITP